MKRKFLFAVLVFLCGTNVVLSQGWRVGPTVGLNVGTISYSTAYRNAINAGINSSTSISYGSVVKFQVGALLDYAVSDRLSIRSGLLYTAKGGSTRVTATQYGTTQSAKAAFELNYLDIPLLLNVAVGNKGLRLVGGPVLGVTLNAKYVIPSGTYTGAGSSTNYKIGSDANSAVMPTDLSICLGLVRELQLSDRPLEIGLYTQPSLSSWTTITKKQADKSARTLMFGLRVAYLFELRR